MEFGPSSRPPEESRLAAALRAPGAFALDADKGTLLAPAGAHVDPAVWPALAPLARDPGAGAALLDLPLEGRFAPPVSCACRVMALEDGRRAVLVVPAAGRGPIAAGHAATPRPGVHSETSPAFHHAQAHAAPGMTLSDRASPGAPQRILWRSDADGVITAVSPELARRLGEEGDAVGRRWSELIGEAIDDPDGRLRKCLEERETATGLAIRWKREGAAPLALQWSGAPVFEGRRFAGFRGFLLVAAAPTGELAPAPAAPMVMPAQHRQPAETPPGAPHLSETERNAFREIARALGARGFETPPRVGVMGQAPPAAAEGREEAGAAAAFSPDEASRSAEAEREESEAAIAAAEGIAAIDEGAARDEGEFDAGAPEESPAKATPPSEADQPLPTLDAGQGIGDAAEKILADPVAMETVSDAAGEHSPETGMPAAAEASAAPTAVEPETAATGGIDRPAAAAPPDPPPQASAQLLPFPTPAPADETSGDSLAAHARDLVDRLPVGVLVNRGGRALFVNRTLLDLLDYPSLAAIEAHGGVASLFRGRAPLSERDGPTGPVLLAARGGNSVAVDARLQGISWQGAPATLVTFRRAVDVELGQKLRAAELELRAREADLREMRAVLDTATDGVALMDEDGRLLSLNRAAEALFGYDQNEVAGEPVSILFAPESHAPAADYFEGLKAGGVRSVLNDGRELIGRVRQGGRIPLFVAFGQIGDRAERRFCAVLRDLSPWKKAERDLIEARRAAEAASAQKSDFLARISHEIRTPLNAIIGFAEVMMEERFGAVGNERYRDYLRDIHASGGHVISLVNDLLDLSKIEAGKLELSFAGVSANEVLRAAVSLMQPQSQRARVVLRTALAQKLPPVVADERALKQVVINLLSNAVKFTDPGGQVIVSTTLTDLGEVAIRIRDTGVGMSEKELAEAMEPFRQIATTRRQGGTGLGLPLTKALVEANRASLKLSSVKDEGTLAEVVFPPTRVLAE